MKKISRIIATLVIVLGMGFAFTGNASAAIKVGDACGDGGTYKLQSGKDGTGGDSDYECVGSKGNNCAGAAGLIGGAKCAKGEGMNEDLLQTANVIINVILLVVGLISVAFLIYGGIQYTTSAGAADKVKNAKNTIMYAIIGLIIAILAFAITNFVISSISGKA